MRGDLGFPVRLGFTKLGKVRFVSHRDVARAFERAFRVEALPLAFTQGFSPRPKVSFGLALGTGHESLAEYLDVELAEPIELDGLGAALDVALPEGIAVTGVAALAERAPSLQEAVTAVVLRARLVGITEAELDRALQEARAAVTLPVTTTRKGRPVVEDLRPALRRLAVVPDGPGAPDVPSAVVEAEVATHPRGLRPADLITALRDLAGVFPSEHEHRVLRTRQWIERDGARLEPLEADRAAPPALPARVLSKGLSDDRREPAGGDDLRINHDSEAQAAELRIA